MTVTTSETSTTAPASTDAEVYTFEKGTWQHTLQLSATADTKVTSLKILAGKRLWMGAKAAVEEFIDPTNDTSSTDPSGETLAAAIKVTGLSASSVSKIKNVALAARDRDDFDFEAFVDATDKPSLDKADKRVRALVAADKAPEEEAKQDTAFEEAVTAVAEVAPKTSTTVEGLLQIALTKAGDADEFVKVLIDVLSGPTKIHNAEACQAFIRTFAAENGSRIKAAKPAKASTSEANAAKRAAPVKAKAAPVKAKPAPVSKSKGDPNERMLPAAQDSEASEPADETPAQPEDFDWDDIDTEGTDTPEAVTSTPVPTKAKPAPVKAGPVKTKATPIKRA